MSGHTNGVGVVITGVVVVVVGAVVVVVVAMVVDVSGPHLCALAGTHKPTVTEKMVVGGQKN